MRVLTVINGTGMVLHGPDGDLAADFAYTFDGGEVGNIEYESFSADGAKVHVTGVSIHPGTAKDTLVNALQAPKVRSSIAVRLSESVTLVSALQ